MYTIVIGIRKHIDSILKNYLAAVRLGIVCRGGDVNDEARTVTFKNITKKQAVKIASKIKSIENVEQIARAIVIKED